MPIYEYRCQTCLKRSSVFVRSMNTTVRARCEHCKGTKMQRLVSRVTVVRGTDSFDDIDESMFAGVDENDPKSMARFARKMRDQMGEDAGPEFDEAIEQMESGAFPDGSEDDDDGRMGD